MLRSHIDNAAVAFYTIAAITLLAIGFYADAAFFAVLAIFWFSLASGLSNNSHIDDGAVVFFTACTGIFVLVGFYFAATIFAVLAVWFFVLGHGLNTSNSTWRYRHTRRWGSHKRSR